ncbi:uncharacterized protein EKO05_0001718 [Ascochyta rabiei]|uniref:Uncharacterized protein n=1 Tax=Didymella rabiei TaxID=5454 RepID=A0A163BDG9_DIDRA|nr:uncharacterized protein EKO05_0001718 [Ascochyta rabiei]KZM21710.1 hypothetical protein ST47_g7117 [Ascochyta rabiei]UPX11095.1 hypothetical protein EKO05_0001718 [Ascochyta rabiei]
MAPSATTAHVSWAPTSRHPRDERSPHTTSRAITIPGARPAFPVPSILRNKDKGAGHVHHHLDNITDYYPRDRYSLYQRSQPTWQELRIEKSEALITSNVASSRDKGRSWVGLQRNAPVCVPRPTVAVKEVAIVPEYMPPCENKVEINKYWWQTEMQKRARRAVDRDSGYQSEEQQDEKGVCVKKV